MKLVQSMKASCKAEEHKFYRGEESMTEECNAIKCKKLYTKNTGNIPQNDINCVLT